MISVRGSCKDGRDGAGDLPSSHRLAVISGSAMSAALHPYCSDFIAAPRPARRRSPIRRHRNETFAVRLGTRVPRSGVGAGFVYALLPTVVSSVSTMDNISVYDEQHCALRAATIYTAHSSRRRTGRDLAAHTRRR